MKLPIQAVPVIREDSTARVLRGAEGITPSDPCYSDRYCGGKRIGDYVHCHNCKNHGGKSIQRATGCQKC
jgi:hypothetical protein